MVKMNRWSREKLLRAKWPIRTALNSDFCRMKRLEILILLHGFDSSQPQGYPQDYDRRYPFIYLGEKKKQNKTKQKTKTKTKTIGT